MNALDRIMSRSTPQENGCIHWGGALNAKGYGFAGGRWRLTIDTTPMVHRLVYIATHGALDAGETVDHTCHNADAACDPKSCMHRRCVNPDHLEAVSQAENNRRAAASRAACARGHAWRPETTLVRANGVRRCRECARITDKASRARRAASTMFPEGAA